MYFTALKLHYFVMQSLALLQKNPRDVDGTAWMTQCARGGFFSLPQEGFYFISEGGIK